MRLLLPILSLFLAVGSSARATASSVPAPAPITQEQFVAALTRDLAAHFSLEGELQLELLRPWIAPATAASGWTVEIAEYPTSASASMLLRYRLHADRKPVSEGSLVVRARHWREVWAARVPLATGTVFDPAQLEPRRADLFREREVVPVTSGDRSQVFARPVSAGRLLSWRDIARRPLVKKGQIVEVAATEGRLLVTLKALALENGAQGDTVTLRNPESQKSFTALVVDENRVQVSF